MKGMLILALFLNLFSIVKFANRNKDEIKIGRNNKIDFARSISIAKRIDNDIK